MYYLLNRPTQKSPLYGKSIVSVDQFTPEIIETLFSAVDDLQYCKAQNYYCKDKILANLFYEPSTRTSSSFIAAMERCGGSVISINEVNYSSVAKGESLHDTVRTLECYADVIVLRHPQVGSVAEAASVTRKPIINAGDGIGEHPTQALLDLYTIRKELGKIDGTTVTLLGDLKHGRTVHSLAKLLSHYDVKLRYVAPPSLKMPKDLMLELATRGADQHGYENLDNVLSETDALYVTRVQKERFASEEEYGKVRNSYIITPEVLKDAKSDMIVMHPFPRVGEITEEVDADPRAAYFRQMEYGMYVRMGILTLVLNEWLT